MPRHADDDTSVAIHLRLGRSTWERYANAAAEICKPLSTYLRERLEREDKQLEELASIRRTLESFSSSLSPDPASRASLTSVNAASHQAIVLEILLICRSIAQPQRTEVAQGEVARLGLPVWRGPTAR
jgi:predicted DNA-binding protein